MGFFSQSRNHVGLTMLVWCYHSPFSLHISSSFICVILQCHSSTVYIKRSKVYNRPHVEECTHGTMYTTDIISWCVVPLLGNKKSNLGFMFRIHLFVVQTQLRRESKMKPLDRQGLLSCGSLPLTESHLTICRLIQNASLVIWNLTSFSNHFPPLLVDIVFHKPNLNTT